MEGSFFPEFLRALLKDFLKPRNFVIGEIGALAEMGEQRACRASENALEEGFAFLPHTLFAGEVWRVHIDLSLAADGNDPFPGKTREERVHGFVMPVSFMGKRLVNIRRCDWRAVPQGIEDFPFGWRDFCFHNADSYICRRIVLHL